MNYFDYIYAKQDRGTVAYINYNAAHNPDINRRPQAHTVLSEEELERHIRNAISGKDSGIHLIEETMHDELLRQFNPQPKLVK